MSEIFANTTLLRKSYFSTEKGTSDTEYEAETGKEVLKDKVVAIYFSAGWSPPCQQFTPLLLELFTEARTRGLPFQVVFVSLDQSEEDMVKYFTEKHGDWFLTPFNDPIVQDLINKYNISYVPKLVVVRADGEVVTMKGRKDVQDKGIVCFRNWLSLSNIQEKKTN